MEPSANRECRVRCCDASTTDKSQACTSFRRETRLHNDAFAAAALEIYAAAQSRPSTWAEVEKVPARGADLNAWRAKEQLDGIFRVFQPFDVGQETACLDREQKAFGNRSSPIAEGVLLRKPVKGVIDFDGMKFARTMPSCSREGNAADKNHQSTACNASQKCPRGPMPAPHAPALRVGTKSVRPPSIYLRVRPPSIYLRVRRSDARVRAALRAARDRPDAPRRRAAVRVWRARARCDAPERPSLFKASVVARERLVDDRPRVDLCRRPSFCDDALPWGGGGNFTPAFLALDSPIAIACFELRTPCFPSRT
jgi:hypothetical protein